jgi:hypothetical protein
MVAVAVVVVEVARRQLLHSHRLVRRRVCMDSVVD